MALSRKNLICHCQMGQARSGSRRVPAVSWVGSSFECTHRTVSAARAWTLRWARTLNANLARVLDHGHGPASRASPVPLPRSTHTLALLALEHEREDHED
ncbi:hypothetical protein TRAPUB_4315 [Trametes pubescens]|uniref:Uncharacterized protein n=1 Tax=Trametes pubescens TaxID=154538 RepID=A0A1M2W7C9_TRAPU|nr:hypothetical protein TRAPUB_4315 [Trametes pubescens]